MPLKISFNRIIYVRRCECCLILSAKNGSFVVQDNRWDHETEHRTGSHIIHDFSFSVRCIDIERGWNWEKLEEQHLPDYSLATAVSGCLPDSSVRVKVCWFFV